MGALEEARHRQGFARSVTDPQAMRIELQVSHGPSQVSEPPKIKHRKGVSPRLRSSFIPAVTSHLKDRRAELEQCR
eukprot:4660749-Amphidinium_carterae.1